jgi:flagellar FliL protein
MAAAKPDEAKAGAGKDPAGGKASGGSPLMAWLPLVLNLLLMPGLAFAMTKFVLLPKVTGGHEAKAGAEGSGGHAAENESKGDAEKDHKDAKDGKAKFMAGLSSKILVNVSGTMGARYLLASITLVSTKKDLKPLVEQNDEQLRDAAAGALSTKTIADLEKPGARNVIRSELITLFNTILGPGTVTEIYLTEFAIQ